MISAHGNKRKNIIFSVFIVFSFCFFPFYSAAQDAPIPASKPAPKHKAEIKTKTKKTNQPINEKIEQKEVLL